MNIPKIKSPLLGHNQINHDAERYIAQGIREENINVLLFPICTKLTDRLARLYDIRISIAASLKEKGIGEEGILTHPLYLATTKLIQEYHKLDNELAARPKSLNCLD